MKQLFLCVVIKSRYGLVIVFDVEHVAGDAECRYRGQILGAGADALFLFAAVLTGNEPHALFYVKRANALGRVHLVTAHADKVGAERLCLYFELAERLYGVGVAEYLFILRFDRGEYFGHGHYGARFVVDEHDGHERGVFVGSSRYVLGMNEPVLSGSYALDLKALGFEPLCRLGDAAVFDRGNDDFFALAQPCVSRAE